MSAQLENPLDLTFSDRLKLLLPGGLHLANVARRERRKGEAELHILPDLVDKARLALDIGANKGVYSYLMRGLSAGVHAFEPHPKMLRFLRRNIGDWASVHGFALSDRNGRAELRIPRWKNGYSNQGASLSTVKVEAEYFAVTVETMRLDDLGLGPVGFMKIDVEGFELAVLTGAADTIARDRPVMLIEIEEKHSKRPIAESVAAVCGYGYRCRALLDGVLTELPDAAAQERAARAGIFNFVFLPIQSDRSA